MINEYIICHDDGTFAGPSCKVREYPDAKLFTNKKEAERFARTINSPSTVVSTKDYAEGRV